jgi:RNA polymerase sigma-70 factor, ECF subfamily
MTQQAQTQTQSAGGPVAFESIFPFLPRVYSFQSKLPALVAAEQELLGAFAGSRGAADPDQKLRLIHTVARGRASQEAGCLPTSGVESTRDRILETFALKLSSMPEFLSDNDIRPLTESGLDRSALVETVSTVAIAQLLHTLQRAFESDVEYRSVRPLLFTDMSPEHSAQIPYIEMPSIESDDLKRSFATLREQYGFVPNLFRIQGYCPEFVSAQVKILEALLFGEDHLSRVQKELVVLHVAALNLNTYQVTMQLKILSLFGIGAGECDQIIDNLPTSPVSQADRVLLEEVGKLNLNSTSARFNLSRLRDHGFSEPQIVEAVAVGAFTNFLSIVQFGLSPVPDFPPRRVFTRKDLYPSETHLRPTSDSSFVDPDSTLVAQVKEGNTEVFAELVRRHTRRVFGTLAGMLGNIDDARDSTQDVFLKAFQNIDKFQGRSKFSTWIMSIAVNTGTELLRQRRPTESLDDTDDDSCFRPRQIQSWVPDPEQQLAKAQINDLVRQGVVRLPEKYRVALLLRDINQIPTEEAAAALNLSVPALKARVLRGRLMLRESLAPHFSRPRGDSDV